MYKFMQGPILVFAFEFSLFSILFTLIVWQLSIPVSNIAVVCLAALITIYFAIREIAQMVGGRREEMKLYRKQDYDNDRASQIRQSQNQSGALHHALRAKQSSETTGSSEPQPKIHHSLGQSLGHAFGHGLGRSLGHRGGQGDGHGDGHGEGIGHIFHHHEKGNSKASDPSGNDGSAVPNAALGHEIHRGDVELHKLVRATSILRGKLETVRSKTDQNGAAADAAASLPVDTETAAAAAAAADGTRATQTPPLPRVSFPAEMKVDEQESEDSSLGTADVDVERGDEDTSKNSWSFRDMVWSSRDSSRFITVYLFMPVSWRSDAFNWVDLGMLTSCFMVEAHLLHHAIEHLDRATDESDEGIDLTQSEYTLRATCILFLWLEFFGFLKGTSMKMATFILMIQEILVNVDAFIFVFLCIIVMFAMMYHVLLRDVEGISEWRDFDMSLWQTWTYSLGEFDDVAFQTDHASVLFSALMLVVVIIMMNILIAIVSDSYTDAMNRSGPLFWRARVSCREMCVCLCEFVG